MCHALLVWEIKIYIKKSLGYTGLAAASDNAYQLLAHGRWFSLGTPASSTTKTGSNDIAEILLKVALNIINQIKSNLKDRQDIT
jgi:actin-like ATPase involved in cell morphogenesis